MLCVKHIACLPRVKGGKRWILPVIVAEQTRATERENVGYSLKVDLILPPHIPDEPYYALPGREQNLEELLTTFQDRQGPSALVIDGLGGIGKTAFAVELARRALRRQLFEKVVGESAKQEHFIGGEIVPVSEATLDFNTFLDAIARQLDYWDIPSLSPEEKQSKLAQLLRQHRYLILVDNLETVNNAQKLVVELRGFLSSSRALITSREKVPQDFVRSLSLHEFELKDALFFLQKDLEQRGRDHQLAQAPREKLTEIWEVTGGAPLAMRLVVAQTRSLDIDIVLRHLKQAGNKLYSFIFRQSWQLLTLPAQLILIYIGRTVPATVSWEEPQGPFRLPDRARVRFFVLAEVIEDFAFFHKGYGVGAVELQGPVPRIQRFPVPFQPNQH
jgi:hypothetical protein